MIVIVEPSLHKTVLKDPGIMLQELCQSPQMLHQLLLNTHTRTHMRTEKYTDYKVDIWCRHGNDMVWMLWSKRTRLKQGVCAGAWYKFKCWSVCLCTITQLRRVLLTSMCVYCCWLPLWHLSLSLIFAILSLFLKWLNHPFVLPLPFTPLHSCLSNTHTSTVIVLPIKLEAASPWFRHV